MNSKLGVIEFELWSNSLTLANFPIINWLGTHNVLRTVCSFFFLFSFHALRDSEEECNGFFFFFFNPTQLCHSVWITVCERASALDDCESFYYLLYDMVVCNIHFTGDLVEQICSNSLVLKLKVLLIKSDYPRSTTISLPIFARHCRGQLHCVLTRHNTKQISSEKQLVVHNECETAVQHDTVPANQKRLMFNIWLWMGFWTSGICSCQGYSTSTKLIRNFCMYHFGMKIRPPVLH